MVININKIYIYFLLKIISISGTKDNNAVRDCDKNIK